MATSFNGTYAEAREKSLSRTTERGTRTASAVRPGLGADARQCHVMRFGAP